MRLLRRFETWIFSSDRSETKTQSYGPLQDERYSILSSLNYLINDLANIQHNKEMIVESLNRQNDNSNVLCGILEKAIMHGINGTEDKTKEHYRPYVFWTILRKIRRLSNGNEIILRKCIDTAKWHTGHQTPYGKWRCWIRIALNAGVFHKTMEFLYTEEAGSVLAHHYEKWALLRCQETSSVFLALVTCLETMNFQLCINDFTLDNDKVVNDISRANSSPSNAYTSSYESEESPAIVLDSIGLGTPRHESTDLMIDDHVRNKCFGQALEEICTNSFYSPYARIDNRIALPLIFEELIKYLETTCNEKRLFRTTISRYQLDPLKKLLDTHGSISSIRKIDPHVAGSLLLQFLRDLLEPLLMCSKYDAFIACGHIEDRVERNNKLSELIMQLEPSHQLVSSKLFQFLYMVQLPEHANENGITLDHLALTFAPAILRKYPNNKMVENEETNTDENLDMRLATIGAKVVGDMITDQESVFGRAREIIGLRFEKVNRTIKRLEDTRNMLQTKASLDDQGHVRLFLQIQRVLQKFLVLKSKSINLEAIYSDKLEEEDRNCMRWETFVSPRCFDHAEKLDINPAKGYLRRRCISLSESNLYGHNTLGIWPSVSNRRSKDDDDLIESTEKALETKVQGLFLQPLTSFKRRRNHSDTESGSFVESSSQSEHLSYLPPVIRSSVIDNTQYQEQRSLTEESLSKTILETEREETTLGPLDRNCHSEPDRIYSSELTSPETNLMYPIGETLRDKVVTEENPAFIASERRIITVECSNTESELKEILNDLILNVEKIALNNGEPFSSAKPNIIDIGSPSQLAVKESMYSSFQDYQSSPQSPSRKSMRSGLTSPNSLMSISSYLLSPTVEMQFEDKISHTLDLNIWENVGFDKSDVTQDFVIGGILYVRCLLYYIQNYPCEALETIWRRAKRSENDYSFPLAGATLVNLLANLLCMRPASDETPLDLVYLSTKPFWPLLESANFFYELFCFSFSLLEYNWRTSNCKSFHFSRLLQSTKEQLVWLTSRGLPTVHSIRTLWETLRNTGPKAIDSQNVYPQCPKFCIDEEIHNSSYALSISSNDSESLSPSHKKIYTLKSHAGVTTRLLQQSNILGSAHANDIESVLPSYYQGYDWKLLYSISEHGASLATMVSRTKGYDATLLIIRSTAGTVFGAYISEKWHFSQTYYGNGETFLFSFCGIDFSKYSWSRSNNYFILCTADALAVGGGRGFGIYLDGELNMGGSSYCETFNSSPLDVTEQFQCAELEVWAFTQNDRSHLLLEAFSPIVAKIHNKQTTVKK